MGVGYQNINFDELVSASVRMHAKDFVENIMDNNYLYKSLKDKGKIREADGGTEIFEPLMFNTNTTIGSYGPYGVLDTSPQDTLTGANYQWKFININVSIDGPTEFKNAGVNRKIELVKAKMMQAKYTLDVYMNEILFLDGTGNNGLDMPGLLTYIEPAPFSTVGGIDSNVHVQWRNRHIASVGSFASNGLDMMRSLYNSTSSGTLKPTQILTTQAIYEAYEKTVTNIYRTMDLSVADIGFRNIMFKETPTMFNDNCQTGYMYFVNDEFLNLVMGKGYNPKMGDWIRPYNVDAKSMNMSLYGTMTCTNRRRQGLGTDITTP